MIVDAGRSESVDLCDLVRSRRSIRVFRPDPLPETLVLGLLQDALWAPSPHNSQPWRFTVLFDREDKEHLASAMAHQLTQELQADGLTRDEIQAQVARSRTRVSMAPVVVLCSLVTDGLVSYPDQRRTELERTMAVQSVGAVLQTLFLLAAQRGVGSCWMAAPMYCPEIVRDATSLPPQFEPQALVLMGYPAAPGKIRKRRLLDEVVTVR